MRHTQGKRLRAKLLEIKPNFSGGSTVVRGYLAYHAVPTNIHALGSFRDHVARWWCAHCGDAVSAIASRGGG